MKHAFSIRKPAFSYDSGVLLNANATGVFRYWFSNSDSRKSLRKRSRSPKLTIELPIVKNACVFESRLSSISLTALFHFRPKNHHLHTGSRSKTGADPCPKSSKNGVWQQQQAGRRLQCLPPTTSRKLHAPWLSLKETTCPHKPKTLNKFKETLNKKP